MDSRRPLRVLHVAPTVSVADGISLAVVEMLRSLRDQPGVTIQLLVGRYRDLDLHPAIAQMDNKSVVVLPMRQILNGRLGHNFAYPPGFTRRLRSLAASADLVHIHGLWLYPTVLGAPTIRRLGRPYVISVHGALMFESLRRSRMKKWLALAAGERKNVTAASALLTTSQNENDQLRQAGFSAPTTVVPLAVDPDAIAFFAHGHKDKAMSHAGVRTVLAVSRFHPQKRLVELVEVFVANTASFPDWRLRIVGPDDQEGYRRQVYEAASASAAAGRISVETALRGASLWQAYADADLFAHPSGFESFGLVIGEALAAGLPVIATTGAPWSELRSHDCGWWIEPTLGALITSLREAMSSPPKRLSEMGARGAKLVAERYSLSALGSTLLSLYREYASTT